MAKCNRPPCGYVGATGHPTMEEYDNLPPDARKFLQDAPLNICPSRVFLTVPSDEWHLLLKAAMRRETIHAYGPDHPQAKE